MSATPTFPGRNASSESPSPLPVPLNQTRSSLPPVNGSTGVPPEGNATATAPVPTPSATLRPSASQVAWFGNGSNATAPSTSAPGWNQTQAHTPTRTLTPTASTAPSNASTPVFPDRSVAVSPQRSPSNASALPPDRNSSAQLSPSQSVQPSPLPSSTLPFERNATTAPTQRPGDDNRTSPFPSPSERVNQSSPVPSRDPPATNISSSPKPSALPNATASQRVGPPVRLAIRIYRAAGTADTITTGQNATLEWFAVDADSNSVPCPPGSAALSVSVNRQVVARFDIPNVTANVTMQRAMLPVPRPLPVAWAPGRAVVSIDLAARGAVLSGVMEVQFMSPDIDVLPMVPLPIKGGEPAQIRVNTARPGNLVVSVDMNPRNWTRIVDIASIAVAAGPSADVEWIPDRCIPLPAVGIDSASAITTSPFALNVRLLVNGTAAIIWTAPRDWLSLSVCPSPSPSASMSTSRAVSPSASVSSSPMTSPSNSSLTSPSASQTASGSTSAATSASASAATSASGSAITSATASLPSLASPSSQASTSVSPTPATPTPSERAREERTATPSPSAPPRGAIVQVPIRISITVPANTSADQVVGTLVEVLSSGNTDIGVRLREQFATRTQQPMDNVVILAVINRMTGRITWLGRNSTVNRGVRKLQVLRSLQASGECQVPDSSDVTLSSSSQSSSSSTGIDVILGVFVPPPQCSSSSTVATPGASPAPVADVAAQASSLTSLLQDTSSATFTSTASMSLVDALSLAASLPASAFQVQVDTQSASVQSLASNPGSTNPGAQATPINVTLIAAVVGGVVGAIIIGTVLTGVYMRSRRDKADSQRRKRDSEFPVLQSAKGAQREVEQEPDISKHGPHAVYNPMLLAEANQRTKRMTATSLQPLDATGAPVNPAQARQLAAVMASRNASFRLAVNRAQMTRGPAAR